MRLTELLPELQEVGIGIVGRWEHPEKNKKGLTLGDPLKYFPYVTGPQYPVDCTREDDPDLSATEVSIIRRRFGIEEA
jgi:hypothetical protein